MDINLLRQRQIQEILNQDRNINLQVIELQQRALSKYEENNAPLTTGDSQTLQNAEIATERLLGLMQQKMTLLATVPENLSSFVQFHGLETLQKINTNDEILNGYNGMVRVMTDSASSPLLRQNLKNSFAQLESPVGLIEAKLTNLTTILAGQALTYNRTLATRRGASEDQAINNFRVWSR